MANEASTSEPGIPVKTKRRSRPWHRLLGVVTALPIIWVTLTGGLLNHTVGWKLDQIQLDHPWLLRAYGMTPSGDPRGMAVGPWRIAEWDGQIFLNGNAVEVSGNLIGAVADGDGVAIVTSDAVLRTDESGDVIETLDAVSLPAPPLTGVAELRGKTLLKNADGWHEADADWLEFVPATEAPFSTAALATVENETVKAGLRSAWSRGGLPASRVILDLHAGRFLGGFTTYFYDFVVICTLILCTTGLILFFRTPRRNR